jgi:hypothetical protein
VHQVKFGGIPLSWIESEQGHVVQWCWFLGGEHGGRGDFDEQYLDEKLHSRGQEMAGMAEG